jgi:hypothetical protein
MMPEPGFFIETAATSFDFYTKIVQLLYYTVDVHHNFVNYMIIKFKS